MENSILQHQADYKPEVWRDYSFAELGNWVHLLTARSEHRVTPEKRFKDLEDARNYLAMMELKLTDLSR